MRSNLLALLGLALVGASATAGAQAAPRIAYVNPQAIFAAAPGRADAEATFRKETESYRAELTKMGDALNAMMQAYQKDEAKLTPADRERRQRAMAAKEDSLRERQSQLEQQATQRQNELMAPIMESVRKVLEDIRAEDGYAMILSNEPGASPILVADKNLDITERVVARLRTMSASRPAAPTARPGAPTSQPAGVTRPTTRPPAE